MYPGYYATRNPDKPAVIMADHKAVITYRELEQRSCRLAQWLWGRGLRPGDHMAVYAECHARYFEIAWAALRSGLYLIPVNPHFGFNEAAYMLENSGSRVLIATQTNAPVAERLAAQVPTLEHSLMIDGELDGFESYEDAVAQCPPERLAEEPLGDVLVYSSGSTGRPKGIKLPLSGRAMEDGLESGLNSQWHKHVRIDENSVFLVGGALHHSAPLLHSIYSHIVGATVVVQSKFDAEQALSIIETYRVTHGFFVPTMFVRLLRLDAETRGRYDMSSLRFALHGGAPCPVQVKRQMIKWWGPLLEEYYGASEPIGLTWIGSEEWLARPGSVGRAIVGELHILDDDSRPLPTGEVGTVYFAGGDEFEYLDDPDKTREAILPDGRATVGDVGYVDEAGYLYLVDRKQFTIISGGVNIYPLEIEQCLLSHPAVDDVAVIGVPDEEFGEAVKAVVLLIEPEQSVDGLDQELIEHCHRHLAKFKCPRTVDFVLELPREASGKLFKQKLKDIYWS